MTAGYVITLGSLESLEMYMYNGVYSTILSPPTKNLWRPEKEATFADYIAMKQGENIYFFMKRKIYGIGKLVVMNNDCKFLNFPGANIPTSYNYSETKNDLLWDEGEHSVNQRWVCVFKPDPYFFRKGIDMDDTLLSSPTKFKMLRTLQGVSFIKVDDEENQAIKDFLLINNQDALENPTEENVFPSKYSQCHSSIEQKIHQNEDNYNFNVRDFLLSCSHGTKLTHEMALEMGLLFQLSKKDRDTINIFGDWDYISHQVVASPFKPVIYMDKMDIFGYSFIKDYESAKSRFLVIELKSNLAHEKDVDQLLTYVDWVKDEYSYRDYSLINAYLVAYKFKEDVIKYAKNFGVRKYTMSKKPARSKEWSNLKLVKYSFNDKDCSIEFNLVK